MDKKTCKANFGVLLLALHLLSSQVVRAQNTTDAPMNITKTDAMNYTMAPTSTMNVTDKNGCGRMDSFTLLLPLALSASLLHGWSQ